MKEYASPLMSQAFTDLKALEEYPSKSEKQAIAKRWNSESIKNADIERSILLAAREDRNGRKSYTNEDVYLFNRLHNWASQYKKLSEWMQGESYDFIRHLIENKLEFLKDKGIFDNEGKVKVRHMTSAAKYQIGLYESYKKFLKERSNEHSTEHEKIEELAKQLSEMLTDTKDTYLNKVREYAKRAYCLAKEKSEKPRSTKVKHIISFKNEEEYADWLVEQSMHKFESDVKTLAVRSLKKLSDLDHMELRYANSDDACFIETVITDGINFVHARTIIAAEYSDYVAPHFRFIVTSRKAKR